MILKKYQETVIEDLKNYLDNILITKNPSKAYTKLWNDKQVRVGYNGMPTYKDVLPGVPSVCLKVPTGGGKTLLACASLKVIFDRMSIDKKKLVVWLVPWSTILSQTYKALSDATHMYRQYLNRDFSSKVEIYNKNQALNGQNFNPSTLNEQLSIVLLSFDSLRSKNKDERKVYEENSNLVQFTDFYDDDSSLIDGIDKSALIQVLNQMNPVVVIDESHNARSDLSLEMIKNLNPSFVLELTATPKEESNIISIVSAEKLKQESMVKLPVIAYNRPTVERVIVESVDLRNVLEKCAIEEEKKSGTYIRPIVLFQAQPKNDEDNITFEKIKKSLIDCGIPKEHIAIKTSKINEIEKVNLLSRDCEIRYIITVNALKEGWDCPFAYILGSLANRTSRIDVEQILGRILRQPYQKEYSNKLLNMSYVLTSSNDFNSALSSILEGLNSAGFSKNDCRVIADKPITTPTTTQNISIFDSVEPEETRNASEEVFDINAVTTEIKKNIMSSSTSEANKSQTAESESASPTESSNEILNNLVETALSQGDEYQAQIETYEKEDNSGLAHELIEKMNKYKLSEKVKEKIMDLELPQFCHNIEGTIFDQVGEAFTTLIGKEDLSNGFKLSSIGIPTDLTSSTDNVYKIDVETTSEGSIAKQFILRKNESEAFKNILQMIPEQARIKTCKNKLVMDLSGKLKEISHNDLVQYIDRIIATFTKEDDLIDLQNNIMSIELKIKNYVEKALDDYRITYFKELINLGKIFVKPTYKFANFIYPTTTVTQFPNTMYTEEEDSLTDVEIAFATKVSNLPNILCWHRNIEKKGFCINGFINHYPDFIVITNSGKIIMVETKGEHLANDDSRKKLELGNIWSKYSGPDKYKYYFAFLKNPMDAEGSYTVDKLIEIISQL